MNESSQNALLKVLEEPPQYATIILTVQNPGRIINTIHSRCTKVNFNSLSLEDIKSILNNNEIDSELYEYSCGSAGKMQKILDSSYINLIKDLEEAIFKTNLLEMNDAISKIKSQSNIKEIIEDVFELLIAKLKTRLEDNPLLIANQIETIEETRNNISRNANLDTALDYMMVKLWEQNKR
jgi:DNA polymerase-3 subunit delta'